jgi:FlaA1/EpsC-like NDP-sugar epimerase
MMKRTRLGRTLFFVLGDVVLLFFSLYLAFLLRFEWDIPPIYSVPLCGVIFVAVKIPVFALFRLYSMSWSYVGVIELLDIVKATGVSGFLLLILVFLVNPYGVFSGFPRSVLALDFMLATGFIGGFRLLKRLLHHMTMNPLKGGRRTLIVGAGNAGELIIRDMWRHQEGIKYCPVGMVDDDEPKIGNFVQGVKVLGATSQIPELADELDIETIFIAIPSATSSQLKEIMTYIRRSPVKDVKVIPDIKRSINRNVALSDMKEISIEDVLGREQVKVNDRDIDGFIRGKKVLVTGAGGSIGSEIVRQVVARDPKQVLALDVDETDLFNLEHDIRSLYQGVPMVPVVADICDGDKMARVFDRYKPDIVLHAAAYKHVPLMEEYPEEAVKVNVFGTLNLVEESVKAGAEKFVMISTDKAVSPTSIMGSTKRVAEELVKYYNSRNHTKFISVRFGNVVGSRGSVIPIFRNQILKGGPVTVTHKDMERFFMSIPEAVALVLQAGAMGEGGEVYVLDMGQPVRILDVAEEMIRLHGLEPDKDIPIVFTGVRKGEKLTEELVTPLEMVEPTKHPKISENRNHNLKEDMIERIGILREALKNPEKQTINAALKKIVPAYNPPEQ